MFDSTDVKTKLTENVAAKLNELVPDRIFDDSVGNTVYQVQCSSEWIEVTEAIFRSWTGLRRVNGEDHHGPVYKFGVAGESKPYTGSRSCGCSICQTTVVPELKVN